MPTFTPTQAKYLSFIHAYTEEFGVPPSETEIAEAMNVQPPSVNGMLKTLVKKELISKEPGVARSIEILIDTDQIPRWKKKLHCKMEFRGPADASQEWFDQRARELIQFRKAQRRKAKNKIATRNSSSPGTVFRLKITLCDTKPPIWRRIETHDASIEQLHELIQVAMGWTNSHLHEFVVGETRFTHPDFLQDQVDDFGSENYDGLNITDWIAQHGEKLRLKYMYDFGDSWEHDVVLEGVFPADADIEYPRCIKGKLACPPEDVGGVWGFYDFVEAVTNSKHERHQELLEWYGPFDPTDFDPIQTTELMQQGLPTHL